MIKFRPHPIPDAALDADIAIPRQEGARQDLHGQGPGRAAVANAAPGAGARSAVGMVGPQRAKERRGYVVE
jgi:hypothetical protein